MPFSSFPRKRESISIKQFWAPACAGATDLPTFYEIIILESFINLLNSCYQKIILDNNIFWYYYFIKGGYMGLVKTSITIPEDLYRGAKKVSNNFSAVTAEALKEYLKRQKIRKAVASFASWEK